MQAYIYIYVYIYICVCVLCHRVLLQTVFHLYLVAVLLCDTSLTHDVYTCVHVCVYIYIYRYKQIQIETWSLVSKSGNFNLTNIAVALLCSNPKS